MSPAFTVYIKFVACLLSNPGVCHDQQLQFSTEQLLTPQQCMLMAMPRLADWSEHNKKWQVSRFSCASKRDERV